MGTAAGRSINKAKIIMAENSSRTDGGTDVFSVRWAEREEIKKSHTRATGGPDGGRMKKVF